MDRKTRNILALTYWSYKDPLLQTAVLSHLKIIKDIIPNNSKIYLLSVDQPSFRMSKDERIVEEEKLKEYNIELITFKYGKFSPVLIIRFFLLFFKLLSLLLSKNISHIHAWCSQAAGIGMILSKLTGRELIIDSYEPHAESMVENGTWKSNSIAFKLLFAIEKLSTKQATYLIACVKKMEDYIEKKYHLKRKVIPKAACVDLSLFSDLQEKDKSLVQKYNLQNKIVMIYAGKFGGIYLDKEAFGLMKAAYEYWGDRFRVILLTSHTDREIASFFEKEEIPYEVCIKEYVTHNDVPRYMKLADFAIAPIRSVPTKRYCSPIKTGEYWAMGLPVIITENISDDSSIIEQEDIGYVLQELTIQEYKKAVLKIDSILQGEIFDLSKRIRTIAVKNRSYDLAKDLYRNIYGI